MTAEEHAKMHSELKDSNLENPHSFCFRGFHEKANDPTSEIVGVLGMSVAWDEALLNLLPDNVYGLDVVIKVRFQPKETNKTYVSFLRT